MKTTDTTPVEPDAFVRTCPPRFIDSESGQVIEPQISEKDLESLEPGEIVHVREPGSKAKHYRIDSLEPAEEDERETALVTRVPTIYRDGLILCLLLAGAWFGIRALFQLLF